MKRSLNFLVALLFLIAAVTAAFSIHINADSLILQDGFYYSVKTKSTGAIYGRSDSDNDLIIPRTISSYYIDEIADSAFKGDENIFTLDLMRDNMLTRIGSFAFADCSNMSGGIVFPYRVNSIGVSAFTNCNSLESVSFADSWISIIPTECFYRCSSLNNVVLNERVTRIDKLAFAECPSLASITIPDSVLYISPSAFNNDENLVIYCYTDSYAQQYAIDNGIEYVLIDAPAPTEPPTGENTEPTTEIPTTEPVEVTFILGDADGDGDVTIVDATVIQRVLVELHPDPDGMVALRGSADGDTLNILHATKIQRWLAMYEIEEPIGTEVTRTLA